MMYLSGCTSKHYEQAIIDLGVGLVVQPGNSYLKRLDRFAAWGADNGCAAVVNHAVVLNPAWSLGQWVKMLGAIMDLSPEVRALCIYLLVPDVPCDHEGTLDRFHLYRSWAVLTGLPIAFALQNGATKETVPWDLFDVAFMAGTTEWKTGRPAFDLTCEARARGKHVHFGRVNSRERWDLVATFGADSADGTFMRFGKPASMVAQLKVWIDNDVPRLTQQAAVV
jgi:hypothetical protein